MSGIDKWVPFFEESSQSRDTASWWKLITEKVLSWGMIVKGVVSDRAKALVKLGESSYLDVASMPDLFHYMQDISRAAGLQIGRKRKQALKALQTAEESVKEKLKEVFEKVDEVYQSYRREIQQINKTIHPFNEHDEWTSESEVEKGLLHSFTAIGQLAPKLGIDIATDKASKVLAQIWPIAKAVQAWIELTRSEIDQLVAEQIISPSEKLWLVCCVLPFVYWQIQLSRTQAKLQNQDLRIHYKHRLEVAQQKYEAHDLTRDIPDHRQKELLLLAHQLAITFQRASSQTEGRNGYLSFVNHAHKGFPQNRLKVLTVVHNYDIKRADGSTPAQRLFRRDFPDLFEFLCQNVTGFKEPRSRKAMSLPTSHLQP
ncbi:MAG: hypothetical protein GY777_16300 [Candidatus Brocadiaceae bacterium]|nr:hypothetical protein [Candidatus Brocadiaceae bacterium]